MELKKGIYTLSGGVDPIMITEKYGCPVYVYDTAVIERQYKKLISAFKVSYMVIFITNVSCKWSNVFQAIFRNGTWVI